MPANKYYNKKTEIDGITFDSKKEAGRYQQLKTLQRANLIASLSLQPSFLLVVNGVKIGTYKADFQYLDTTTGKIIFEDVKGMKTPVYKLKKKLVKALHNVDIQEV